LNNKHSPLTHELNDLELKLQNGQKLTLEELNKLKLIQHKLKVNNESELIKID